MFSRMRLKEKDSTSVVYGYSIAEPDALIDGEVEFTPGTKKTRLLKTATGDDCGHHARHWVLPYFGSAVREKNYPEKYVLAFG